jgi:hypothetical protein
VSNPPPPPPPPVSRSPSTAVPGAAARSAVGPPASPTPAGPSNVKIFGAEAVGTGVLMIIGPGSAILAVDAIGVFGVAFAFGLALLAMAYAIGHVSGCHINPAVTLGFWLSRKITVARAVWYWAAQGVGRSSGG